LAKRRASLPAKISAFIKSSPGNQQKHARDLVKLLSPDIREWWQAREGASRTADADEGPFNRFRQALFNQLFPEMLEVGNVVAFPQQYLEALERAALDITVSPPVVSHQAQQPKTRGRISPFRTNFINRLMIEWYAPRLPPRAREALTLKFVEKLSNEEIAQRMEIAKTTVPSTVQRGIATLRIAARRDARGLKPRMRPRRKVKKR
jgi:RNA polymerase sigma factor (sigma-70 family)